MLFNRDPSLDLRYRLADFKLYKDLPLSNFTTSDFRDTGPGTLVFSMAELIIDPGATAIIPLGGVAYSTYDLATVGSITIEDLSDGTSQVYPVPQGHGQDVPVPEPTTLLLWGTILAGAGLSARWRRRRQN
jgi:hypothetical protein